MGKYFRHGGAFVPSARSLAVAAVSFALGGAAFGQDAGFVPHRLLIKFSASCAPERQRELLNSHGASVVGEILNRRVKMLLLPNDRSEKALAATLARRPDVEFCEPDYLVPLCSTPSDPSFATQWHLNKIGAPAAWSYTTGSDATTIAIIDTGVDGSHPDLKPNMTAGWNFYGGNSDTSDVNGHGTAVAGTAAAVGNNGIGVASVAWNCRIMPLRVADSSGMSSDSMIAQALTYAADHGARVANASFWVSGLQTVSDAAKYFQSKGGVFVSSAGNSGYVHSAPQDPYQLVIGATTSSDALASFSDYGSDISLTAPGTSIYTTNRGGGYGTWSGTSFSAPIVAGAAALLISYNPGLTGVQVQSILKSNSDDLGSVGWDPVFGSGRLNIGRALAAAAGTPGVFDGVAPTLSISNPTDAAPVSGTIPITVSASDNQDVASMALYLDGSLIKSTSNSSAQFDWNTFGVANGMHTIRAVATDLAGNSAAQFVTVDVENSLDITPPQIAIISPTGGKIGKQMSVSTQVSDDRGLVRAELWVDGSLAQTDQSAPWEFLAEYLEMADREPYFAVPCLRRGWQPGNFTDN